MILVVDDNALNRTILMKLVRHYGFKGLTAANGLEAVEAVTKEKDIKLVLMDLMMPVMDGDEATRKIREMKSLEDLPVIALTADSSEDLPSKCLEAGFNEVITKPIQKDAIEQIFTKYLKVE